MQPSSSPVGATGPSSSPFAFGQVLTSSPFNDFETQTTLWSPEATRQGNHGHASQSVTLALNEVGAIIADGLRPQPPADGTFTNELQSNTVHFKSRYLFVSQIDMTNAGFDQDTEMNKVLHAMKTYTAFLRAALFYDKGVWLRFDCLEDACEAVRLLSEENVIAEHKDSYQFAKAKVQDTFSINEFEAQIMLVVRIGYVGLVVGQQQPVFGLQELKLLNPAVERFLQVFGTTYAMAHIFTDENAMTFTYRIEFKSVDAANRAVGCIRHAAQVEILKGNLWQWSTISAEAWTGPRAPNSPHRHQIRYDDQGRMTAYRHQQPSPTGRNEVNTHPSESHNRVRRDRIFDGTDVRTTIMLRNIPNKLDWMGLKNTLDQVCFGTYDFLYLRIDFKSCNNVGYAFINFVDVAGMVAMLDKIENRGWNGFRSNKFAEISYATIQGREALIQKFRNSSVMQETPFCRPHLFLTWQDAVGDQKRNVGCDQAFPTPDNYSKLSRSMNSARSVGLFPPSGIVNANSQRNVVSAYDRGTPRDLVHTMSAYRQQDVMAAPITQYDRMQCEAWYAATAGFGPNGNVAFNDIPYGSVQQFLTMYRGNRSTNLGPIAPPRMVRAPQGFLPAPPGGQFRSSGMMMAPSSAYGAGQMPGSWPRHGY